MAVNKYRVQMGRVLCNLDKFSIIILVALPATFTAQGSFQVKSTRNFGLPPGF